MPHPIRAFLPRVVLTLSILAAGLAAAACALALGMLWFILRENGTYRESMAAPRSPDNLEGDV